MPVKRTKAERKEFLAIAKQGIDALIKNIQSIITIRRDKLEYIIASNIAGGHVILADSHGVGKTSLARALAGSIDWKDFQLASKSRRSKQSKSISKDTKNSLKESNEVTMEPFSRIQCTVDLLPQDITGFNYYDMQTGKQKFNKGPIFSHFCLCDEINLLTPKTQGSFFEAMEEQMVSIEGKTYPLLDPFFIIATMNLRGSHLFPLPAPQLDRFMIQISLGYPPLEEEIKIVLRHGQDDSWQGFGPVVSADELLAWQKLVDQIDIHPDIIHYTVRLIRKTREYPGVITGISPRGGIKMSRLARALALVRGLSFVDIDMIKELVYPTFSHRLETEDASLAPEEILSRVVKEVRV